MIRELQWLRTRSTSRAHSACPLESHTEFRVSNPLVWGYKGRQPCRIRKTRGQSCDVILGECCFGVWPEGRPPPTPLRTDDTPKSDSSLVRHTRTQWHQHDVYLTLYLNNSHTCVRCKRITLASKSAVEKMLICRVLVIAYSTAVSMRSTASKSAVDPFQIMGI